MSARNMAKRTAAGTLALAVCLGGGAIALASAASADANFKFDTRIQGDDRYGTAIAASKAAFDKADNVILVNGYATVDGLTASYLAGVANAPILYVSDKGADDATKAEIKRLGAKNIWLVGGEKVIPASVSDAIKGDGYNVQRINGSDRYETAALIAEAGIKISGKKPSTVFVASGTSFADALAVSPVAFVKGYPIILTDKDSTSDFSKKELGVIGTDSKVLVGGTAVVSDKVAADLSIKSDARVAGDDRAVTANKISDWAKKTQGFNPANAALVGGTNGNGADSLVAAPLLGKSFTTLHFAGWDATAVYMKDHASELTGKGFVFGGKAAVSDSQVSAAQSAAQTVASLNSLKIAGSGSATVVNGKNRIYTVSGLDDSKTYAIKLFVAGKIKSDGTFTQTTEPSTANSMIGSGVADAGSAASSITVLNGVAASSPTTAKSVNGVITFTVTGPSNADTNKVAPVLFLDADGSGTLNVDAKTGTPKETYGVGDVTTFTPAEAADGLTTGGGTGATQVGAAGTVTAAGDGWFTASFDYGTGPTTTYRTFKFDGNDSYKVDGINASFANFAKSVSIGDTLTFSYVQDKDAVSTFALTNVVGTSPTISGTPTTGSAQTSLDLSFADTSNVTSYVVYRAVKTATNTPAFPATTNDDFPAPYSKIAEIKDTDPTSGTYTWTDKGLTAGTTYRYAVVAVSPGKNAAAVVAEAATSNTAATSPKSVYAAQTAATGLSGTLDSTDVVKVAFDKALDTTLTGDTIQVRDADGTLVNLVHGTNATFSLNSGAEVLNGVSYPANQVLTVTLTSTPSGAQVVQTGSVSGAQYPLTIVDSANINGASSGPVWSISGSSDVTIEQ